MTTFTCIRIGGDPTCWWGWLGEYLDDLQEFAPGIQQMHTATVGEFGRRLLTVSDLDFYGTPLPPVGPAMEYRFSLHLAAHDDIAKRGLENKAKLGTPCLEVGAANFLCCARDFYEEDNGEAIVWRADGEIIEVEAPYEGAPEGTLPRFKVRFSDGGEAMAKLGMLRFPGEKAKKAKKERRRRRDRSRSRSRSRRGDRAAPPPRSRSRSRDRPAPPARARSRSYDRGRRDDRSRSRGRDRAAPPPRSRSPRHFRPPPHHVTRNYRPAGSPRRARSPPPRRRSPSPRRRDRSPPHGSPWRRRSPSPRRRDDRDRPPPRRSRSPPRRSPRRDDRSGPRYRPPRGPPPPERQRGRRDDRDAVAEDSRWRPK